MKAKHAVLLVVAVTLGLILQSGCGESRKKEQPPVGIQNPPVQPRDVTPPGADVQEEKGVPKIEVASPIHDFGVIGPGKAVKCEFNFKNVGTGNLHITKIISTCQCMLGKLDKLDYALGESGTVKVTYRSSSTAMPVEKHLFILSNDKKSPRFELTIKGRIELKVAINPPKILSLFIDRENGGAIPITLTSKDKKAFAEKTTHVLKLKVDTEKLKKNLRGSISIGLSHPETSRVTLSWAALPLYTLSPPRILLQSAKAGEVVKRTIWVKSNYKKKVEIESITSTKGYIAVVDQTQQGNSVNLAVEITPPPQTSKASRWMTDKMTIKMKDGQTLYVTASGFYATTSLR